MATVSPYGQFSAYAPTRTRTTAAALTAPQPIASPFGSLSNLIQNTQTYAPIQTAPATPTSKAPTMTTQTPTPAPTRVPGSGLAQYGVSQYGSLAPLLFSNPMTAQWSAGKGIQAPAGAVSGTPSNAPMNAPTFRLPSVNYTPNQHAIDQLGSFGSGRTVPQWMMDSYANKIGSMGGNADAPIPFGVNPGGFPGSTPQAPMPQPTQPTQRQMPSAGVSGKTAPYLGITQGIANAVQGATSQGLYK